MLHKEIEVNKDYTFSWTIYQYAIQVIPSSATITITNNSGSSVQSGSGTIASDGTITYTLLTANNATIDSNFKCVLSYVYSGTTTTQAELFDIVKQPIINVVSDIDLYSYLKELRRKIYFYEGQCSLNGNLNSITDDGLISDDRNFKGGKIELYISSTIVHEANITAYDKSTGTISFSPAYASTVSTTLNYIARESYKQYIDTAFSDHIHPIVRKKLGTTGGFLDSNVFKMMIIYKSLSIICFSEIEANDDKWDIRYKKFEQMYNDQLSIFNEPYDSNEDGSISESEKEDAFSFMTRNVRR